MYEKILVKIAQKIKIKNKIKPPKTFIIVGYLRRL